MPETLEPAEDVMLAAPPRSRNHAHLRTSSGLVNAWPFAIALLLMLAIAMYVLRGPPGPPAELIPDHGAYFGSWVAPRTGESRVEAIQRVETQIGRKFAIDHQYYRWDSEFPGPYEEWTSEHGRIPFLNWKPMRSDGTPVPWARVASGELDDALIQRADAVAAFGRSMYFSFHHEPEDDVQAWGSPSEFVAAYRHVVDVFRSRGVDNVAFVWTMMSWTFDPRSGRSALDFYPGDGYVDLMGSDGYNFYPGRTGVQWDSFESIFRPSHDFAVQRGLPWMVVEWGVQEDPAVPGRKADWFGDAREVAKSWPDLKGLLYFDEDKDHTWVTDSSTSSLDAYAAFAADGYFDPVAG